VKVIELKNPGPPAEFFGIDFDGAKLYSKQESMEIGHVIVAGCLNDLQFVIGSIISVYCVFH